MFAQEAEDTMDPFTEDEEEDMEAELTLSPSPNLNHPRTISPGIPSFFCLLSLSFSLFLSHPHTLFLFISHF